MVDGGWWMVDGDEYLSLDKGGVKRMQSSPTGTRHWEGVSLSCRGLILTSTRMSLHPHTHPQNHSEINLV